MRHAFFFAAFIGMLPCCGVGDRITASTAKPRDAPYSSYYLRKGDALQAVDGDPARTGYTEWQVWLYPQSVHLTRSGSGLAYVRWGVIQGPSASAVMEQLATYQQFERAYTRFFGANTWGRLTFAYSVGPIAATRLQERNDSYALLSKINLLNQRIEEVVDNLLPSLLNGEPDEKTVPLQQYFEQVRNSMQEVARFYDKLSRLPAERSYLSQELARLTPGVDQADSAVQKVRTTLPNVKLPVSKDWMIHSEDMGREGTIKLTVTEMGSSAWVQQSWTGGDGSMSGTKIITIVPYQDIGSVDIRVSGWGNDHQWTLRLQPANRNGFPESFTSPERRTAKRTYPAVNLMTREQFLYLEFSNPTEAQDAYAFFVYHKERGV